MGRPYQRKPFFTKIPANPYDIIRTTSDAFFAADYCSFITTKPNRVFLATLEREYDVRRTTITKILRDTYDLAAIVTEIMLARGGNDPQGEKIVAGYTGAISELQKLLKDETLDAGWPGFGRKTTEGIAEDVAHLKRQRREWAMLFHVEPKLWGKPRPVMTTAWRNQAALVHWYITGRIEETAAKRERDLDTHGHGAAIFRLLSEMLRNLYAHPAFNGRRELSKDKIRGMVGNFQRMPKESRQALMRLILPDA